MSRFLELRPMLLEIKDSPFDSDAYIFEIKFDGIRCIAFIDGDVRLQSRNLRDMTRLYPELLDIKKNVKKPCVLDGEIVCLGKDGKPDFGLLLSRNRQKQKKIEEEAIENPVTFVVFDILSIGEKDLEDLPLSKRKEILSKSVKESDRITISTIFENGKTLFKEVKKMGLEGIVAKKKDSKYYEGIRTNEWLKIKNYITEKFFVCGMTLEKTGEIRYLFLCRKNGNKYIFEDKIYFGGKKNDNQYILEFANKNRGEKLFGIKEEIIWLKPKLACIVQYLEKTKKGGKRHAVYKGIERKINLKKE